MYTWLSVMPEAHGDYLLWYLHWQLFVRPTLSEMLFRIPQWEQVLHRCCLTLRDRISTVVTLSRFRSSARAHYQNSDGNSDLSASRSTEATMPVRSDCQSITDWYHTSDVHSSRGTWRCPATRYLLYSVGYAIYFSERYWQFIGFPDVISPRPASSLFKLFAACHLPTSPWRDFLFWNRNISSESAPPETIMIWTWPGFIYDILGRGCVIQSTAAVFRKELDIL